MRYIIFFILGLTSTLSCNADLQSDFEPVACGELSKSADMYFFELSRYCTDNPHKCEDNRVAGYTIKNCSISSWNDDSFNITYHFERIKKTGSSWGIGSGHYVYITESATSNCLFNSQYEWSCLFESANFDIYHRPKKYPFHETYPQQYQNRFNNGLESAIEEFGL